MALVALIIHVLGTLSEIESTVSGIESELDYGGRRNRGDGILSEVESTLSGIESTVSTIEIELDSIRSIRRTLFSMESTLSSISHTVKLLQAEYFIGDLFAPIITPRMV